MARDDELAGVTGAEAAPAGAAAVYARLREEILTGELAGGAVLSQVQLAARLGVSRTPLREALRMLQAEGLVESEHNRRVRVAAFAIDDLEQVYAARIVLEALGIRLTVPLLSDEELEGLRKCVAEMASFKDRSDAVGWEVPHRRFHRQLVAHAGDHLLRMIDQQADQALRYRMLYVTGEPRSWAQATTDHERLVEACARRDAPAAADLIARHYAQTALTLIATAEPAHDPGPIRTALRTVLRLDAPLDAGGQEPQRRTKSA
jgi:DNA-binding GntR family transcriptional regulator